MSAAAPATPAAPAAPAPPLEGARAAKSYALIALVSGFTAMMAAEGSDWILIGGAATSAVYLFGFLALNPRLVGLELIGLTALGYVLLPPGAPVYWMMGCALGGGAAAILSGCESEEDHQFFIPPLAAIAATFILFTLGRAGGWADSPAIVRGWIAGYGEAIAQTLTLRQIAVARDLDWESLSPRVGLAAVSAMVGFWVLLLWMLNRFARRRLERIRPLAGSLILFRIRPGYTFILIAALVAEILSVRFGREGLESLAFPLFAICGAGFLVVHFAVLFFLVALRRARSPGGRPWLSALLLAGGALMVLYIGPVIGLADVWVDFRKVRAIRKKFS